MPKVDPPPPDDIQEERRKPKYIIDPKDVTKKDDLRARAWAASVIRKYESRLTNKVKDGTILHSGFVDPEDIDVANIYPFPDLHWIIYYRGGLFHLALISGRRLLFTSSFLKV